MAVSRQSWKSVTLSDKKNHSDKLTNRTIKTMANPFVVYIFTFSLMIALYGLQWSDLYPSLTAELHLFFLSTFFLSAIFYSLSKKIIGPATYCPGKIYKYLGYIFWSTLVGELLLNGIPILRVYNGERFYDIEAGSRHLHAFFIWSFYSVVSFSSFLYYKNKKYFIAAVSPLIGFLIFVYRGPAIILLLAWFFVYVIKNNGLNFWKTIFISIFIALAIFVNGILGDLRSPGEIESAGSPSQSFQDSIFPKNFFWGYFYATHPIANLQTSVNQIDKPYSYLFREFLLNEFVLDTITRKVLLILNPDEQDRLIPFISRDQLYSWQQPLVSEGMNLSTMYGRAYGYMGWVGALIVYFYYSVFIFLYLKAIRGGPYQVPCLALLNTLVVLTPLNNMLVSAAIFPILIVGLVFSIFESSKFFRTLLKLDLSKSKVAR